jgi:hypothetical protein
MPTPTLPSLPAVPPPALRPRLVHLTRLAAGAALLLGLLGWGLTQWGLHQLAGQLREALGPRTELGAIEVQSLGLSLRDLRVKAAPGWPADEELRAGRVYLRPSWRSLFSGPWRIARIEVSDARLVLLRGRDGRLQWLPHLQAIAGRLGTDEAAPSPQRASPPLVIDRIRLQGVQIELYDDSFKPPLKRPHRLQLSEVQARIDGVQLPAASAPVAFKLSAQVPGPGQGSPGQLQLDGQVTPNSRDAELHLAMQGVDLRLLQPWLLKAVDAGVQAGTLDLRLNASVKAQQLSAPGQLTLRGLRLNSGPGLWQQLSGVSRDAVLATMQRDGQITLDFQLQGRLDDPAFSLNDSLAKRFAAGLAEAVGVSVSGVVQGLGRAVKGLFGR